MKTRIIQTRFWEDELNDNIGLEAQHLYIYLLTCQQVNICGYFQLRDGTIKFQAKLTDKQLEVAKIDLEKNKKVFFKDGWIWVCNARKNNHYENSELNKVACEKELSVIPDSIKDYFNTTIDSSIYTNHKQEIINNKSEIRNKKEEITLQKEGDKKSKEYVIDNLELFKSKFPSIDVEFEFQHMCDWLATKGKETKDWSARFRMWLNSDIPKKQSNKIIARET
jgi:hypothetical protein